MAPRYDPVTSAEPDPHGCREGTVALRDHMLGRFPGLRYGAGTASGCYLAGGLNDDKKTPSVHGRGRGVDLAGTGTLLDEAFDYAVANADAFGIQEAIANGRIWTSRNPTVRPYTVNPHRDHIHLAQNLDGAAGNVPGLTMGVPDMTLEDHRAIQQFITGIAISESNRTIGTLQTNLRELVPAVVKGTIDAIRPLLDAGTAIDVDALAAEIADRVHFTPTAPVDPDALAASVAADLAARLAQ